MQNADYIVAEKINKYREPQIIFEDNHLLAVNKWPGVPAQQDAKGRPDMFNLVKDYLKISKNKKGDAWLGLLHRLDQPASGIMVFALNSKSAGRMSELFRNNKIGRYYLALVHGTPLEPFAELKDYLSLGKKNGRYFLCPQGEGREASLNYRLLHSFDFEKQTLSLLLVKLASGRPHQIRLQCAEHGLPLLGDRRYGLNTKLDLKMPTLALHAYLLDFIHPVRKEELKLKAELFYGPEWINPSFLPAREILDTDLIEQKLKLMEEL